MLKRSQHDWIDYIPGPKLSEISTRQLNGKNPAVPLKTVRWDQNWPTAGTSDHLRSHHWSSINQGLATVPFWVYWTSPFWVAIIDHKNLMVGWCSMGTFNDPCQSWFLQSFSLPSGEKISIIIEIIKHRIHGAGIYANIKGVYWWDPCYHIYSSTMDLMGLKYFKMTYYQGPAVNLPITCGNIR